MTDCENHRPLGLCPHCRTLTVEQTVQVEASVDRVSFSVSDIQEAASLLEASNKAHVCSVCGVGLYVVEEKEHRDPETFVCEDCFEKRG